MVKKRVVATPLTSIMKVGGSSRMMMPTIDRSPPENMMMNSESTNSNFMKMIKKPKSQEKIVVVSKPHH